MRKALAELHAAVLLAGATGLFGRFLTLQEVPLVWYRLLFTSVLLVPILYVSGKMEKVSYGAAARMGWAGMLLGVHWVLFYSSIRASNVSIGVSIQYLLRFEALKKVSTFTVNLTYNLEPVYSIIFAMILFGEARELNFSFYAGLVLIIASVLLQNSTVRDAL